MTPMNDVVTARGALRRGPGQPRQGCPPAHGHRHICVDIALPGTLRACFARSPFAKAKICGVDTSAALALEGEARFVGDPVALVLAASRYLAEDGADLIEVNSDQH
jgi:CO/xanthine dehydrogenase Mo-binding subunit